MKKKDGRSYWAFIKYGNLAFSFGTTTIITLLLGFWGGRYLDRVFHTTPLFLVVGLVGGAFISFKSLFDFMEAMDHLEERVLGKSDEEKEKRPLSTKEAGNSYPLQENKKRSWTLRRFQRRKP